MAILGFTIPPHAMADHDHGKEVNRCPNVGCGLLQVPDGRILRCPPSCKMSRAKNVELTARELSGIGRSTGTSNPGPTPQRKVG